MDTEPKRKPHLSSMVRGDSYWSHLDRYAESTLYKNFNRIIHQPIQTITKQDIPYRVLSHWDSQGLIECERNNDTGWRKFSIAGSLWLFIIQELRKYGFGIKLIKEVKNSLFEETGQLQLFMTFNLNFAIDRGKPLYLIVFENGHSECFDYNQYKTALALNLLKTHLVINLNTLLKKLNIPNLPKTDFPLELECSSDEYLLFDMIKNTEFDHATICKTDSGIMDRVEFKTTSDRRKKVIELLQQGDNLDITIKKRNGKIIYTETKCIEKV